MEERIQRVSTARRDRDPGPLRNASRIGSLAGQIARAGHHPILYPGISSDPGSFSSGRHPLYDYVHSRQLYLVISTAITTDIYRDMIAPKIHKNISSEALDRRALILNRIMILVIAVVSLWIAIPLPKFLTVLLWTGLGASPWPPVRASSWERSSGGPQGLLPSLR